jgi:hypothetical protein
MSTDQADENHEAMPGGAPLQRGVRRRLVEQLREAAMYQRHDPSTRRVLLFAAIQIEEDGEELRRHGQEPLVSAGPDDLEVYDGIWRQYIRDSMRMGAANLRRMLGREDA